ncbi:MAG: hypothetical protein OEV06_01730 [Anaerolineae bacterium]|nr:hypothetical protein [Anaerolineae bacterium]
MKRKKKSGKKHILLFYLHTMDRLRRMAFLMVVFMGATWWFGRENLPGILGDFTFLGAAVALLVAAFALAGRRMGYVQPRPDHLLITSGLFRLKVSYQSIVSVHPMEFVMLFSPRKMKWADKNFTEPYFGKTVVAIKLNQFPLPKLILRAFFPRYFFHPQEKAGFILVVPDWMKLSTDLDSQMTAYREKRGQRPKLSGYRGLYGQIDE